MRLELWQAYVERASAYWLTGVGFGRSMTVIEGSGIRVGATTNNYLWSVVEFGVGGAGLFVAALVSLWGRLARAGRGALASGAIGRALFVAWAVAGCFLDTMAMRETWLVLGMVGALGRKSAGEGTVVTEDGAVGLRRSPGGVAAFRGAGLSYLNPTDSAREGGRPGGVFERARG